MTGPNMPKALPSSSGGNISLISPSPCGSITAPNRPCTTRPAISSSGLPETPHSSEAAVKPKAPITNMRFLP